MFVLLCYFVDNFHNITLSVLLSLIEFGENTNLSSNLLHQTYKFRVKSAVAANLIANKIMYTIACLTQLQHVKVLMRFE